MIEEYGVLGMLAGGGRKADGKSRLGLFPFMANVVNFIIFPPLPNSGSWSCWKITRPLRPLPI